MSLNQWTGFYVIGTPVMKELMFSAHNFMHVIQTIGNVAGKVQKKCSKDQYTILPTKGKFKSLPRPAPPRPACVTSLIFYDGSNAFLPYYILTGSNIIPSVNLFCFNCKD